MIGRDNYNRPGQVSCLLNNNKVWPDRLSDQRLKRESRASFIHGAENDDSLISENMCAAN